MSHYKPYPAYKDSGVEWLGQVPVTWGISPLWAVATVNDDERKAFENESDEFEYVDISTVTLETGISKPALLLVKDAPSRAQRKAKSGDIVVSTVRTYLRAIGKVLPEHEPAVFSTGFAIVRANDVSAAYLYYALLSEHFLFDVEAHSTGVSYPAINASDLMKLKILIPTLAEQQEIAKHLDRETARIDGLICRKTRFIELLREKRQALIAHAVTKGLDPNAPMKNSGIEWLGDVPTHWSAKCVKYVARLESGHTPSMKIAEYWVDCDIPWVSLGDSSQLREVDYIHDTAKYLNKKGLQGSSAHILPIGTVIFTRDATVGLAAITGREMAVSQHLIGWVPGDTIRSEYLLRVFNVMESWLSTLTVGATIKTIGMDDIRTLMTPVPPIEEQDRIVEYVLTWMTKFDGLISTTKSSIELLKERRSALITAAVTGQIDLRETV